MVDLDFLFFRFAPAMKMIFNISYIPQREDFKELTPAMYQAMYAKVSEEDLKALRGQKAMAFLPDDAKVYNRVVDVYGNDLVIVGSGEVSTFASVTNLIEKICKQSNRKFKNLTEKLIYMAQTLPDVFSEGTPYAIHGKLKSSKFGQKGGK